MPVEIQKLGMLSPTALIQLSTKRCSSSSGVHFPRTKWGKNKCSSISTHLSSGFHLHSIFERVDICVSHPSPSRWGCGRKIPHSPDTSLLPLPISNSWAIGSERFGCQMQNHLTQLQPGKHLLSDFCYFDPKLSQGHWRANTCHLLHKIHMSTSSFVVSTHFFPSHPLYVVPKSWFLNVVTGMQNSLEAIKTLEPTSITHNAPLNCSSLQLPFFRILVSNVPFPLLPCDSTLGCH